jgi:hypothetical protein
LLPVPLPLLTPVTLALREFGGRIGALFQNGSGADGDAEERSHHRAPREECPGQAVKPFSVHRFTPFSHVTDQRIARPLLSWCSARGKALHRAAARPLMSPHLRYG